MRKIIIGMVAGAAIAYVAYKMAEQGKLDDICDDMNKLADKTKKKLKDGLDVGKNQVEYLKDRAMSKSEQFKDIVDEVGNKVSEKFNRADPQTK